MSYCALVEFEGGVPTHYEEYRNAWGGAAMIWSVLFDKYLKDEATHGEHDSWLSRMAKPGERCLWDLWRDPRLEECEAVVLLSTFDRMLVDGQHFARMAGDLRAFRELHREAYPDGAVCHLGAWAQHLEGCKADAVGWYGTSVSDDLWQGWNEESEESVPYDLNKNSDHAWLYEALQERNAEE